MARRSRRKKAAEKKIKVAKLWGNSQWTVRYGKLNPGRGRPEAVERMFLFLAEKIPFEAFESVKRHFKKVSSRKNGVYIAHDSMGYETLHRARQHLSKAFRTMESSAIGIEVLFFLRRASQETRTRNRNAPYPGCWPALAVQHEKETIDDQCWTRWGL